MENRSKQQLTGRQERRQQYWNKYRKSKKKHIKSQDTDLVPVAKKSKTETATTKTETTKSDEERNLGKKRYILFVGNLPFNVAAKEVKRHFRCTGGIIDFRLMTKKTTEESKGCGFLEFDNAGSMQKALNLHHSVFGSRKINVEVTCGGGGKGKDREKRLKNKKHKFAQTRKKKDKTRKKETDKTEERISCSRMASETGDKEVCGISHDSLSNLNSEKISGRKKTGSIKDNGKRKSGTSISVEKRKKLKIRDHSNTAACSKRKLDDRSANGFRRHSKNKKAKHDD